MRFVGTDFVGTLVGTTPENGLKMGYFGSFFGKFFQAQRHEKCPRCLIFTHLGHFTKAEREGFESTLARRKIAVDACVPTWRFRGVCDFVYGDIDHTTQL